MRKVFFILLGIVSLASAHEKFSQSNTFGQKSFGIVYPNYDITPGETIPNVTIKDVCAKEYAKKMRHDLKREDKDKIYLAYGLERDANVYQIDHLIPLSLGGSNGIKNLWPLPKVKNAGFVEKQGAAQYLHEQVCQEKIGLSEAQQLMINDWHSVYLKSKGKNK